MKKTIITALLASSITSTAFAGETVSATIQDHYNQVTKNIPHTERVCQNVEVPIYGRQQGSGASGGDVLGGMIIGGLLGKGLTGKDDGAAAGAVLGGVIAADKGNRGRDVIVGYRSENRCQNVTTYSSQVESVYEYSTIEFRVDGRLYRQRFYK